MYSISNNAAGAPRLVAQEPLSAIDFQAIADALGVAPSTARKTGFVAARQAERRQNIDTWWNGLETRNVAAPGDWIVTNLSPDRTVLRDGDGHENAYVLKDDAFHRLYHRDHGATEFGEIYRAKGEVSALYFPGGFEILAPWNETQTADCGYILLSGDEVYGNHKETFEATYRVLS